jgi:hypothetical protein
VAAVLVHRADRVDDVAGGQAVAPGQARLAGRAAAEGAALGQQLGAGRAVDGPVHTAAAEEAVIGGVDDGVNGELRDVGLDSLELHGICRWRHGLRIIVGKRREPP